MNLPCAGRDLRPGDVIIPWYERTATITRLRPYTGPLAHLFPHGARLADFADGCEFRCSGMTIDNDEIYTVKVAGPRP